MSRRVYTDEDRAAGLAALDANGGFVKPTAEAPGVPRKTLEGWRDGSGATPSAEARREEFRQRLADKFGDVALRCVESVTQAKLDNAGLRDTLIAAGIAAEKQRLLMGEPTQINENRRDPSGLYLGLVSKAVDRLGLSREEAIERICRLRPQARAYLLPASTTGGEGVEGAADTEGSPALV